MNETKMIKGYAYAICSALIYGCMPLMAKEIYSLGIHPMTLVLLRNLLAVPVLAVLAFGSGASLIIPVKAIPSISLIAVIGCCLTPILLFSSYTYIASGTATVFHFIYPAVVVFAGVLFLGRRMDVGNLVGVVLCVAGVALFYSPGEAVNWQGSGLALLSGVTYGIYVLLLSRFPHNNITGFAFSFFVAAISSVVMLILCIVSGNLTLPTSFKGWSYCAFFAVAITVGAVVLFQQGTFIIGGEKTSILSTLEPITSVLLGVIVYREKLSVSIIVGSVLVIAASVLIAFLDTPKKKGIEK